nr:MAG TPA: hypothetical protein [Caudoviricetes sp.]
MERARGDTPADRKRCRGSRRKRKNRRGNRAYRIIRGSILRARAKHRRVEAVSCGSRLHRGTD